MLVDELNRRALSVMCHTVSHQHIEFVLVVFDRQHHCHRLTDLHNSADLGSPRTFADLDLHPTLKVVAQEVRGDSVKHVDLEGSEGDGFLVEIVPRAAEFTSLSIETISKTRLRDESMQLT